METTQNEISKQSTPSKKEQNEIEREMRKNEKEKQIRIKKLKAKLPWIIFGLFILGAVYGIVLLANNKDETRLGEAVAVQGRNHISVDTEHSAYNSNPPTSGPHAADLPWGFKTEEVRDENVIHNLEHGGIWISYKNIDEKSINKLHAVANQNRLSVVVSPREANDSNVAIASWGRLMKLDSVDVAKINEFIKQNKNKSPEPLAR